MARDIWFKAPGTSRGSMILCRTIHAGKTRGARVPTSKSPFSDEEVIRRIVRRAEAKGSICMRGGQGGRTQCHSPGPPCAN